MQAPLGSGRQLRSNIVEKRIVNQPFNVEAYWEERYAVGKSSGAGSYGRLAAYKADFLNAFVKKHNVMSVIEFGSGDGNQLKLADYPSYIGYDVSKTAVEMCRKIFSTDRSKQFRLVSDYRGERCDLALSMDVIYHLVEDELFEKYMQTLFGAADRYVIIYSSNDPSLTDLNVHVLHRRFTDWTSTRTDYRLVSQFENPFHIRAKPLGGLQSDYAPSDFYVFERKSLSKRMFNWKYPNRRAELEVLRTGKIPVPPSFGLPNIDYSNGVDWRIVNSEPPPVRWWLNHLKYTRPLLLSSNPADLDRAVKIIKSWVECNSVNPQSDFAWDGHAVAFRSEQLACLKTKIDEQWLDESIQQHGEFLSDPENYQGDWNHGLDQNIGLLSLGYSLKNTTWINLARERSIAAISKMVDWQGVSIEQAVGYHFYNYVRFQDAEDLFEECGAALPADIFDQVHNMTTFVAHATMPNGKWNLLGDTVDDKVERERLRDTDAGFSLSSGQYGKRPVSRFALYHGGYVFGRSGWGESRPFVDESYYSLRFGPGRIIHGHNDHTSLTYFVHQENVIIDAGFHGYTNDKFRDHLRSPAAHNVVYTTDATRFSWHAHTKLTEVEINREWQNYLLIDEPYPKTKRVRSALFVQSPVEVLLVYDRVAGPKRRYEQAWHFDESFALNRDGDYIEAASSKVHVDIYQLWPSDGIEIVQGNEEPIQGWAGYGVFDLRPIPTLLTARSGAEVTFLTAMVFQPVAAIQRVALSQQPIKRDGISRNVTIQVGDNVVNVSLLDDETMQIR